MRRCATRAAAVALAGCAAALLGACAPQHPATGGSVVRVSERDFHISAPARAEAGDVVLRVHNGGPDAHELIVVKTENGKLPLRGDGITVDEEAVQRDEVGALEPGAPGSTRELDLHLTPGRYVLLCNMSGHYLGGMRTTLVVR